MTSVLITGGTGSLGRELVRRLLEREGVDRIVVYSRDEWKQWEMGRELGDARVRYFIGDVRDRSRLGRALVGVESVVHAAALKQVVSCEYNPWECVHTNVVGAQNVIEACLGAGVRRCIGVSSDKAVHPVNVYGASKLCSEKLFIQGNAYSGEGGTEFGVVRYGNVLGSRGSVVGLWREELREKGHVSITDPEMTRFWITIGDAARFVLEVLFGSGRGLIEIPRMPSVRLSDLAQGLGSNGKRVLPVVKGIRPGEKVHETLINEDELPRAWYLDGGYFIQPQHPSWEVCGPTSIEQPQAPYSSDTNSWWLEGEELRGVLGGV